MNSQSYSLFPKQMTSESIHIAPSAKRLTGSLRDVGYSFESAVADLVDNSITSGATEIRIEVLFAGRESTVTISDNGAGMDSATINESMRFGSRRSYGTGDLGRYGLGLKTASLSQCRRIEVHSKQSGKATEARALDLDFIEAVDGWFISDISDEHSNVQQPFLGDSGTTVMWKKLDRVLPAKSPEGGWARRRVEALPNRLSSYLSMVFHRYLAGENVRTVSICVNGEYLSAWDPFARSEPATKSLSPDRFEIESKGGSGIVKLQRYLLPTKSQFSTLAAYEEKSGPEKWNRQQGLYIYRANRLVQWGGWAGIRTPDEHTKFARVSLDFDTDLDEAFNINVAKMRVSIPGELKKMLARPVNELCILADAEYRKSESKANAPEEKAQDTQPAGDRSDSGFGVGLTLRTAAARTGNLDALNEIVAVIKTEMPEVAAYLGFD